MFLGKVSRDGGSLIRESGHLEQRLLRRMRNLCWRQQLPWEFCSLDSMYAGHQDVGSLLLRSINRCRLISQSCNEKLILKGCVICRSASCHDEGLDFHKLGRRKVQSCGCTRGARSRAPMLFTRRSIFNQSSPNGCDVWTWCALLCC